MFKINSTYLLTVTDAYGGWGKENQPICTEYKASFYDRNIIFIQIFEIKHSKGY